MSLYSIIQSSKSLLLDSRIDMIYDHVDQLMWASEWTTLNSELDDLMLNFNDIELDMLLSVVVATLPGEHELVSRSYFVDKCKKAYPDPDLWHGL